MLKSVTFKEGFETKDEENTLEFNTKNTIIICDSCKTKNKLFEKLIYSMSSNLVNNGCLFDSNEELSTVIKVIYMPTTILSLKTDVEQTITITVENPFVLQCNKKEDLWFCTSDKKGLLRVFPFTDFEYDKDFKENLFDIYKDVCIGKYIDGVSYGR